ncbi:cytosolic acyl coenzyme A thioester hydrolase-like isoform X2 [Rhopilema esculentum]|uniref:cytosolic acyl coenzyme A thioester hydrolase-like isoform X2 n=1 Tax=Rhopilema esculentum TaxID=499914 RepID=UPI0031D87D90
MSWNEAPISRYDPVPSLSRSAANPSRERGKQWLLQCALQRSPANMSMENIEVCRVMSPDDANIAGNVHGGTILKMIEEAGVIIATRHCNEGIKNSSCIAGLVRVERTDFLQPMLIGEVANVHAELSYASDHSLEVTVDVWAENLTNGGKRLTNQAYLWYVPVKLTPTPGLGNVPPIKDLTEDQLREGEKRYQKQKKARAHQKSKQDSNNLYNLRPQNILTVEGSDEIPLHSVPYSQSTLISMASPSDCNQFGYCQGGPTMKNMDTVAGIVAFRHCRTNIVTASVESLDFHVPVKLGHVMTFTGRMVFTSNRSMEIEVFVDAEDVVKGECFRCVYALFTYVSLDDKKAVQKVPQLVVRTEDEKQRFKEGQSRYEIKKEERLRALAAKRPKQEK